MGNFFFQVAVLFHPGHPQPKTIETSFRALLGLLLTKLYHYFDVYIHAFMFFLPFIVTLKVGDDL